MCMICAAKLPYDNVKNMYRITPHVTKCLSEKSGIGIDIPPNEMRRLCSKCYIQVQKTN